MRKFLMVVFFVCAAGYGFADEMQDRINALPEAYRELGRGCLKSASFNCCMSSVDNMVLVRAVLREQGKNCPEGYRVDMLKCEDSYAWCEPLAGGAVSPEQGLEKKASELIEKYLQDQPPPEAQDWVSPYYLQIADMGKDAVMPLLSALREEDPLYVKESLSFVHLLGVIADPRAYPVLRDWFLRQEDEASRWRAAISLGACLTGDSVADYVSLFLADQTTGALRAVKEMSGQNFGDSLNQWVEYFQDPEQLEAFRAQCRERSAPLEG